MLFSRGQGIKKITKVEQKRLCLFTLLILFFMVFLGQKLTYKINIYLTVFGSLFEQDNLLNLFNLGVYAKR